MEQFSRYGRELFPQGVNSSHGGNMSFRAGDAMVKGHGSSAAGQMPEGAFQCGLEALRKTPYPSRLLHLLSAAEREGG